MATFCKFMSYKKMDESYDNISDSYKITCVKYGRLCTSQRYCGEKHKWIISEMARNYCRDFKEF